MNKQKFIFLSFLNFGLAIFPLTNPFSQDITSIFVSTCNIGLKEMHSVTNSALSAFLPKTQVASKAKNVLLSLFLQSLTLVPQISL